MPMFGSVLTLITTPKPNCAASIPELSSSG